MDDFLLMKLYNFWRCKNKCFILLIIFLNVEMISKGFCVNEWYV